MAKHANRSKCFDKVFLEYLRLRFEFEPLTHYVMAAITVCDSTGDAYPAFVRGHLNWLAERFLFEPSVDRKGKDLPLGSFPVLSWNKNRLGAQWHRYEDCHDLLDGWLRRDLNSALKRQEDRLMLVEEVEIERTDGADFGTIFSDLEIAGMGKSHTLARAYKKLALPEKYMSGVVPIALVSVDGAYVIETRAAGSGDSRDINF